MLACGSRGVLCVAEEHAAWTAGTPGARGGTSCPECGTVHSAPFALVESSIAAMDSSSRRSFAPWLQLLLFATILIGLALVAIADRLAIPASWPRHDLPPGVARLLPSFAGIVAGASGVMILTLLSSASRVSGLSAFLGAGAALSIAFGGAAILRPYCPPMFSCALAFPVIMMALFPTSTRHQFGRLCAAAFVPAAIVALIVANV